MKYVFEGTVSEIETDGNDIIISFKVCGSEGYILKRDDKKYNVFAEMNNGPSAYMFESNQQIKNSSNKKLLMSALIAGKRIKLQILKGKGTKNQFTINSDTFSIESLSILSN